MKHQIEKLLEQMTKIEKIGVLIFFAILISIQFLTGSTFMGFVTGLLGIIYVVLVRLGSKLCYIAGGLQMTFYVILAYKSKIYGDAIYNFFNIFMQILGWYMWSRREGVKGVVKPKKMKHLNLIGVFIIWFGLWFGLYCLLKISGGNTPHLDSFTTVTIFIATLLSIGAYKEQWYLWSASNFVEIILWTLALTRGEANALAMVVMYVCYFFNGLLGAKNWNKLYKENL